MILTIYIVSVIYCVYKMYSSYSRRNDDPLYTTPALDTMAIVVLAPVLMVVDVSMTWVRLYKERKQ